MKNIITFLVLIVVLNAVGILISYEGVYIGLLVIIIMHLRGWIE